MSVSINGFCDERFAPIREAFVEHFDRGLEIGASLAVTRRGKMVVDLWAGHADPEKTRPWERDTIVPVMSTTKIMTTIAMLTLIDRGRVDLDQRIAHYWPEFAQGGKENVTIRDALTHRAGVPGFDPPVSWDVLTDWDAVTARLAAEPHWFGGRRQICYHAGTYGFPIGEVMRRVDGRLLSAYFRDEIARKLEIDFMIRLGSKQDALRVARLQQPAFVIPPEDVARRVMSSLPLMDFGSWEFQSAELPAMSGLGNGRSIARACAIIANRGTLDGTRLLSGEIIKEAGKEQANGVCPLAGPIRLGLGFGLDSKEFPAPSPASMHWGGYGGSWGLMDPEAQVSFGYAPNLWTGRSVQDPRLPGFFAVLRDLLQTL